uniref:Transformation/transcription domain-associated protein n=1 Tax=Strigamia maritima TaxID=126957 RepID=T1JAK1_STRMM
MAPALNTQDPVAQMNAYRSFVSMLVDPGAKDENKLKAAQELSENFEVLTIVASPQYASFLEHAMKIFLKILQEGEPHFYAELSVQQLRKLILEILHRIPPNENLRPYVKPILTLMFHLLEIENEENVLVCLRIIIELHKQYRPQFNAEIQHFLQFVKNIYRDLPNHLNKIFEPRMPIKIKDLSENVADPILQEIYTITTIQTEKKTLMAYNLIPKAVMSLKVLAELPIIVVLMYQLYKQNVHQDVAEFIPLIMNTIILQPSPQHRSSIHFNKEVFVDFVAAQIKTLSFLAYIIKIYQDVVAQYSVQLVKGMLGLLTLCPQEVAHLRKELLIAARHILATDLRNKFVSCIDKLFDENVLIGSGWTTYESLRPLAYSTLADLVHHVRQNLPLNELAMAVNLFSKNVHDESLPTSIQTMSCKLLLNLVECIRLKSEQENGNGRDLLMRMLEVFVLKFKSIAKLQLPYLQQKCRQQQTSGSSSQATTPLIQPTTPTYLLQQSDVKIDESRSVGSGMMELKEDKNKFGFPTSQMNNYTVADCRSLVKTLVCGVKTITWGTGSCKVGGDASLAQTKHFQPKETLVFIRLVKYALQALDIYAINVGPVGQAQQRIPAMQSVRTKEEKEVLEHFAGVFAMMNQSTFREVFSTTIQYMVERIHKNVALQIVANHFLANAGTSPVFATILVEYLLEKMQDMGCKTKNTTLERSNMYLKLFKLVFGSVSLFAAENELMLKIALQPHLRPVVNRSMELALTAKEPFNYFLLLRALFRSIGGGSHDLLYQEFLPLLPSLLQGLNCLQSGLHKQHMKDLFVELCLTVPVRLSSLLPYLPMLMDPLVSALNGSQTLVSQSLRSQGLRTLELCVDNLQPDFLYEHIQPVRAELMQALWRTLRNPTDSVAHVAFRVLGKFGGGNRKMMVEPQKLEYNSKDSPGPCITVYFQDHKTPIEFPVEKIVETAVNTIKVNSSDPYYRKYSWEVVRCYLISSLQLNDEKHLTQQLLHHPSFATNEIINIQGGAYYKCPDTIARNLQVKALTAMFIGSALKDLRTSVLPTMIAIVRHYTLVAVSQQSGIFSMNNKQQKLSGMDPLVLVDAITVIMGHEEKELCKPGHLALVLLLDIAAMIVGSKERACQLPLIEYIAERMCSLCYDRSWYAKVGGCVGVKTLYEYMTMKWVFEHQYMFLKSLLFVMMDLTGEVSSGAVDMAKNNLEKMLTLCAAPIEPTAQNEEMILAQKKSLYEVTQELIRQVTSSNTNVREEAMHSLQVLASVMNKSVTDVMEPHKEILADIIPPKKHLLRHQPANAQIGLMDGFTFCTTLQPRLFNIDFNVAEHKAFYQELLNLCEHEDSTLQKVQCYKTITNFGPLRKCALRALTACCYVTLPQENVADKIFTVLYKALNSLDSELQEASFECMKKFIVSTTVDIELVHNAVRPLLMTLGDYRSLSLNIVQRLSYLTQLFPNTFNEKLCEQLLTHLKKWFDVTTVSYKSSPRYNGEEIRICAAIINLFHQIPASSGKFVELLITHVLKTEQSLLIEAGSPFRKPLLKFLIRYPGQTVDFFLNETNIKDQQCNRCLEFLLRQSDGKPFRDVLESTPNRLMTMAFGNLQSQQAVPLQSPTSLNKYDLQYLAIRIISILVKEDNHWLPGHRQLIGCLRKIWISDEFQVERHRKADGVDFAHWKEPKMLIKILLSVVKHQPNEIELLFQLLRALTGRFIPDFQFLKTFLEVTVAHSYSVEWKRMAFFKFVELFHDQTFPQDLKAKILQYILIPSFALAFESGNGERLIGGPPAPDQDLPDNVISVFINKVINPEDPFGTSDAVRILLLQFSSLLVEQASPHIHDAANKRQGNKLRRLMTFAWPCLLGKNCVDPATKYHGHLLLSHIIAKFAIHKRIVLQVFHSLLKAHAVEARSVVRQALEILTPAMPVRMEDGNTMLTHWTKKIIVEEGHTVAQLVHMLHLLVRHYKVYFPVRHHLLQHMVNSMTKLGFLQNASIEHRKLAIDLAEVIIKWELQRIRDDLDQNQDSADVPQLMLSNIPLKRSASVESPQDAKRARHLSGASSKSVQTEGSKPIDKIHVDAVVNFVLKIACQVNEAATAPASPGELLSRRCVALLKMALKADVWPNAELKLAWFDKLLMTVDAQQPNFGNICTALELLSFLLTILRREIILTSFKHLQRGIAACMTCTNSKVIRSMHSLLSRLMNIFPTEPTNSNVASKYEELECLYASVCKVVHEGLTNYEKNVGASPSTLFGTLMILKAACMNNPCYIDRLITSFMRVLQRMAREHLTLTSAENNPAVASELLILSLDLVKNRVGVMGQEMRKAFIGNILVGLIEKTNDVKVLKAITKMVEEWVKNKSPIAVNQSPSLREKSILLVKMMQFIEKRFPDDTELNGQFLELVNYVYRDDASKGTELTSKLEPAFLAGLRCTQPLIRAKFFEVFDSSMRRKLHERLLYIVCSQNWEAIGPHYWIKQCIELILVTAVNGLSIQSSSASTMVPSINSIIHLADSQDRNSFSIFSNVKEEPMDVEILDSNKEEEEIDIELTTVSDPSSSKEASSKRSGLSPKQTLHSLITRQMKFLENMRDVKTATFLTATAQLCHTDTKLTHWVWVNLFPRLWGILSERQQQILSSEMTPFWCSGSHVIQKDCHPSAIKTFAESVALCSPPMVIKPCVLKYLGKSHNLWHRATLILEQMAFENGTNSTLKRPITDDTESVNSPQQEILDSLASMYSLLKEDDLWAGLWSKRAKYSETAIGIAYEQQGYFEQAQGAFELAMSKAKQDHSTIAPPASLQSEYRLWEEHWIKCSRELNQWDLLLDFGNAKGCGNPYLVLDSAWRVPNWGLMKEALAQVELNCPREMAWKVNLYRGFVAICHDEHHLNMVERLVEFATNQCIKDWRRLPHIVSHIHISLLQAAQQIMELQEAAQINQGLLPNNLGRQNSMQDMKAIVKTWRNRLPVLADDLSHWNDIFTWRQHHYQFIINHYDNQQDQQSSQVMLGVHSSALAIIHFGKIARKHNLTGVSLDSLSRIHTIPSVPIVDCFQKIRQQVKCYLQMSGLTGKNELQEGLEVIESTNLKFFTKEMTAEFYALKGMFLAQIGRSEDANKAFSAATQLHDVLVKAWALWGDYLEQIFTRDRQISVGISSIICYLHACRHQNESKTRKYLAKVIWLLTYDDEKQSLAEAVDKYSLGVPPVQWLPWIPQLLTCLLRNEGRLILNIISQVGRVYPQAVYFPIRTLYLTLKIEQRERLKSGEAAANINQGKDSDQSSQQQQAETVPIRATPPMWRCSCIMHKQREMHPTILASLEGIVDQMVWFRENWAEEVLRQLRQGLAKCYAIAFENRGAVAEATITTHTMNFMRKLVSTFGVGVENVANSSSVTFASAVSESLARRAQATAQDPVFQRMKVQFTTDFDFTVPGATKLHNLISKLKKWIKILEAKNKLLPKQYLIEERCRFLSNFSEKTAEIELPGEFLLPKHAQYYVKIVRFMPRVDVVQKHNTASRRLYIRGHNGKIYPYLVVNDTCLTDSRREERVLQLLRMLNHFLGKQKETARRFLTFVVPRVVAVSPQMRLVEDNPASISMLDIYKQRCAKHDIEHDVPITRYYERLAAVQARGSQASHQVLRDILKDVQQNYVPRNMLKEWAVHTFSDATHYWTFRKMFTMQLALAGFTEFTLHFTRLNPDMMYVHQDSGLMNIAYFRFDIDDLTGDLDANRPVPFRLTPNMAEFMTSIGVNGPLTLTMIAVARCLVQSNFKIQAFLRAVLRDEIIAWHRKKQDDVPGVQTQDMEGESLIATVNKAVNAIMARLQNLATFDGAESKVSTLVAAANCHDNLCRMDPAWHPWL